MTDENSAPENGQETKMAELTEAEHQKLLKDLEEQKDRYVRLFAEFDNVRKRHERDRIEFVKYANEGLIGEFLHILDDLERSVEAAKANHQDYAAFMKGIELVMARIHDMLKKNGVKPVEATGKRFDPHCHEILMMAESDEHPEGTVIEELQKGYYLGDKVVRTAKVKVAKERPAA